LAPARRPWSLRRRLVVIAALSCLLAWVTGGAATYFIVKRMDGQLFDARLRDITQTLMVFADHEISEIAAQKGAFPSYIDTEGTLQGRYRYQVWAQDGRLVLSSHNAPVDRPLMPLDVTGLATVLTSTETLRVIGIESNNLHYRIQAAESLDQRLALRDLFGLGLVPVIVLSVIALTGLTLWFLRMALLPLKQAADSLGERGPTDMRPLHTDALPAELSPVFEAINQLMRRVEVALHGERAFVAAAAHELRTPLAGLQAQAQLAALTRSSPEQRDAALRAVQEGVDVAAHLVHQLLDLARSDALAVDSTRLLSARSSVDLLALFERALLALGPLAADRGVRLHTQFECPTLRAGEFGIDLILRNLMANAVAYTAPHSAVTVGSRAEPGAVVLWVADQGPGIPEAERGRVFDRFYRIKGQRMPGCGLGLAIVRAMADAHGARIALSDAAGGGLVVTLRFASAA
jgi:signal transduction histidine kinase